jgi:hypothetical protein
MTLSDELFITRSRIEAARRERRVASAVGRRNEAQYLDLELDDLEWEKAELVERIYERP